MAEHLLTDLALRRMKLPQGRKEVFHGDGGNLFVRVRSDSKDWMFVWKRDGIKHKLMLGSTSHLSLADARAAAKEKKSLVAGGLHPRVERHRRRAEQIALDRTFTAQAHTVGELFEQWCQKEVDSCYGDEGAEIRRRFVKDVKPAIGKRDPATVTEADIVAILQTVVERGALRIGGHLLSALRQMFKFEVRRKIATIDPTSKLNKRKWGASR